MIFFLIASKLMRVSQVGQNPPTLMQGVQEAQVQFLGWEDSPKKETATCSSILAWRIRWIGTWWVTVHGVTKSRTWQYTQT